MVQIEKKHSSPGIRIRSMTKSTSSLPQIKLCLNTAFKPVLFVVDSVLSENKFFPPKRNQYHLTIKHTW